MPCTNCPRAYKGQTSRTLAQRIKEHQRSVRYSDIATSVLAEHSNSTGHPIQWDEVHVIDTCPHTSRRCLLESWAIHKEPNPLNRELGSLPHSYKTLIKHSEFTSHQLLITNTHFNYILISFIVNCCIITHHINCHPHVFNHHTLCKPLPLKKAAASCRNIWQRIKSLPSDFQEDYTIVP